MVADVHTVAPEVVVDFLGKIMPFNELDDSLLHSTARHVRVDFFPKGTRLLTMGKSEVEYLYLIQQGGVKSFLTDDEGVVTLKDFRGEGTYIGALGIIRGTLSNMNVETVEDTFCFLIPREVFLDLIRTQPGFAQYYLKSFSEKFVSTAYTELRRHKMTRRSDEDLYLFSIQVGDIVGQKLRKLPATASVREAATEMMKYGIGSLLLYEQGKNDIIGIVTDKDLRNKVVAVGLAYTTPVKAIMTAPVTRVPAQSICFDALLQMMSAGIHHLAVEQKGEIVGVVTSHDIMLLQGISPYALYKEIGNQRTLAGLFPLSQKIPDVIRNLINEGAKAGNITRMIALLNDHILERVLSLVEEKLGPPPLPYCWLLIGSEGRKEQTFKTDQDNAIIYADPINAAQEEAAQNYFSELARLTIDNLVNCGYPLCPANNMAVNPAWCQPIKAWKEYFTAWITKPVPQHLLTSTIFFDFRAGYGKSFLVDELANHISTMTRLHRGYLQHLVRECIVGKAPLSFFKNFIVEKDGKHENELDIKAQGLTPFVNFARVMALAFNIRETNTLARLNALADEGYLDEELRSKAHEAYEMQMQLRLIHQLHQIEQGVLPDDYVNPGQLTDLEKRMLRDSFEVIDRFHLVLKNIFAVS